MSPELQLLLAMLLAHVVGDFVLQRAPVVAGRARGAWWAYAEHGGWHLAALVAALVAFAPTALDRPATLAVLIGLVLAHLAADWVKSRHSGGDRPALGFVLDQLVHVALVAAAWTLLVGPQQASEAAATTWLAARPRVLATALGYLVAIPACGYLNAVLLAPLAARVGPREGDGPDPGLARAGTLIGWLERFLILTAVLARSPAGVGLVLAAKSVFRFEDVRHGRRAAEYFLIGTLLSVSEAVAVGLAVLAVLPA